MADFVTLKHPNTQNDPQFEDVTQSVAADEEREGFTVADWEAAGWVKVEDETPATTSTPQGNVAPIQTPAPTPKASPSA